MWRYDNVNSFVLEKPQNVLSFGKWCNATLTVSAAERNPYPLRFNCRVINSQTTVVLEFTEEFTATRIPLIRQKYSILLTVFFNILEFPGSTFPGEFLFYGTNEDFYTNRVDSYDKSVTEMRFSFRFSLLVQPIIKRATFHSRSFSH